MHYHYASYQISYFDFRKQLKLPDILLILPVCVLPIFFSFCLSAHLLFQTSLPTKSTAAYFIDFGCVVLGCIYFITTCDSKKFSFFPAYSIKWNVQQLSSCMTCTAYIMVNYLIDYSTVNVFFAGHHAPLMVFSRT